MSLLKQIDDKGAVLSWSPLQAYGNFVALGTKDSAGVGFDDHGGELELHALDFGSSDNFGTTLFGKTRATSRFSSIAWSQMSTYQDAFPMGLIAGGMVDGIINVWDPAKIVSNDETALLASVEQHQGSIAGLHFNPHKESSHLLASGGSDAEVYVISLERPDNPSVFIPAPPPNNTKHTADITQVAWNTQVAHILASSAQNGSCCIWDLRQKRAWCELRDPSGGCVADIAWNPDQGLHIITASGDDKNPVLKLWDLRSSTSLPLATLQGGHTEGVLSVSWCPTDTSLILSCGKDNKTILWDLYHLQPVYELPFKDASSQGGSFAHDQDANVFGGFASSASHRRYHVSWSPCLPAVTSASSFDRKVQFFSMTGARSKLGRAPKWLRRPVGATFGFGGKLVTINNIQTSVGQNPKKPNAGGKLKVFQISENPELTASGELFNEAVTKGQLKQYCESKCAQHGGSPTGEVWNLMKVICFGSNAREELLTYLGFDSVSINAHAQTYLATHQLSSLSQQDSNAHNVFGGALETDAKTALDLASLSSMESSRLADLYDTMKSAEKAEPTIREAIIVGNFEMAVDCCLKAGLLAEALLLAQCGGQELRIKTQAAFFERQRHIHPFLNVLHAVIKNQLLEFVMSSDLKRWRETLALLSTYGKSEEFTSLCEALANRLENEVQDKRSASLCYMCATNVQRTVQFWTEELQTANAVTGQLDTLALQEYVEKVMVFTQANPTDNLGSECGQFFARYGELLASQGRLSNAAIYLKGESQPVKILLDRLYHAGNKPPGSRPPVFPFNKVNIEMASSGHAENNVSAVPLAATTVKDVRGAPNPRAVVNARVDPKPVASSATNSANVPTPLTPTASAPSLPPGWLQLVDPASNLPYYVNQATGQSQWEPPVVAQAPVAVAPVPVPSTIPSANQSYQSFDQQHVQAQSISQQAMSQPAQSQPVQSIPSVSSGPGLGSPEADCVIAIGQMIEAIAVSNLTPAEKKQIAMLRQAYSHLNDKLKVGEVSIDILQKLASLTDHLCNRNYAAASAIQTDLANTAWGPHKEWIKGIKILIQLASRK